MSNVEARLKGYLSTICAVHYDLEMVELFETWTLKDVGKKFEKGILQRYLAHRKV